MSDGGMSTLDKAREGAQETITGVMDASGETINKLANIGGGVLDTVEDAFGTAMAENGSDGKYILTDQNQWGWITLYVVTIVLAVLLNLLFVVASLCTKRTRTTGYYLLLNLSIRDILVAALCVPFTMDSEIIAMTWNFGDIYCRCYRFFYYAFLFFLPLTLLFLAFHLFVENCKWNFAGEDGFVPRPWPHTIFIPLIWFLSFVFAAPTIWYSSVREEEDDIYRNDLGARRPQDALVCMHRTVDDLGDWTEGSNFFYIASNLLTFVLPFILLFIPWWALLVQACACCTRKLRSSEFWLSIITVFMILVFEASRAPFELWNFHHILTQWDELKGNFATPPIIPGIDGESYRAVMKWAVYAPALVHPFLYFMFSPEARHGVYILFSRMCSCCCSKSSDVEVASDDEKGRMLGKDEHGNAMGEGDAVPLQSKQEEEM